MPHTFPCPEDRIARYTAHRVDTPPRIDGRLDEACWRAAPRSPRFVDLISGKPTVHATHAAVLWDDDNLYVGFWVEEPFVSAFLTERDSPIYTDNDVEVFIAGKDSYYEFEINAFGTVYEVFYIWEEAYDRGNFSRFPGLQRNAPGIHPFNGVGLTNHPRGPRLGFAQWDLPGLQTGVFMDGTINQHDDRDRGWTVELAFPWAGMEPLAHSDGRSLPPRPGDTWRMDFSRFNQYKEAAPADDSGGWAWTPHGIWDSHVPECFVHVTFAEERVIG